MPDPEAELMDARALFERGLNSAKLGFPDKAVADFQEVAWLEPENYEAQFNLGTAYLSMGWFEQALVNLTRTLELKPDMTDAWGNRAVAYTALGDDASAERDIAEAIRLGAPPDGLDAVISYVKERRQTKGRHRSTQ